MTQTPTSGTDPVRPVDRYENEQTHGLALCAPRVFDDEMAEVAKLRRRQADYLASLPTTAEGCISGAMKLLHEDYEKYPEGFEEALYLSFALAPMIRDMGTAEPCIERDALLFIADRVRCGLEMSARKLDRISDILGNPGRIAREARASACGLR